MILVMLMAKQNNRYFGMKVTIPGCLRGEIIINHPDNLSKKAKYYKEAYSKAGVLKNNKAITITEYHTDDTLEELVKKFI